MFKTYFTIRFYHCKSILGSSWVNFNKAYYFEFVLVGVDVGADHFGLEANK